MKPSELPPDSLGAAANAAAVQSALAIDLQAPARHFGAGVDLSDWLESGTFDSQRVPLDWWQPPSVSPLGVQTLDIDPSRRPIIAAAVAAAGARNLTAQLLIDASRDSTDDMIATGQEPRIGVRLRDVPIGSLPVDCDPRYAGLIKHLSATQGPVKVRAQAVGTDRQGWNLVLLSQPTPYDPRTHFCAGTRSVEVVPGDDQREFLRTLADGPVVPVMLGVSLDDERVTVSVEDRCVGRLGPRNSAEYLPLVRTAIRHSIPATCRGIAASLPDGSTRFDVLVFTRPEVLADICDPQR
ncbi:hypothetical protein BH10ACT3_BH10ACT3_18510 [soil metagenome]